MELDIDVESTFGDCEFIEIIACGTSYHAGLCVKQSLDTHTDFTVSVTVASEYEPSHQQRATDTVALAITQSGETADTLAALRDAKAVGMRTVAVTNTVGSTVTREVDESLFIRAGPEIGVAATKTFVSQVATLTLLAVAVGQYRGTLSAGDATELLDSVQALPGAVQSIPDDEAEIHQTAEEHADGEAFFFIGRQLGHPVALESALKLKEISYDHAEGFPSGELKHGPLALVTPNTPVIAFLTDATDPRETLHSAKEVESRGAPVTRTGWRLNIDMAASVVETKSGSRVFWTQEVETRYHVSFDASLDGTLFSRVLSHITNVALGACSCRVSTLHDMVADTLPSTTASR